MVVFVRLAGAVVAQTVLELLRFGFAVRLALLFDAERDETPDRFTTHRAVPLNGGRFLN